MSIVTPRLKALTVAALLGGAAFVATPAQAWWHGGVFIGLPPVVVAPGPVYPPYYYPPAYYPPPYPYAYPPPAYGQAPPPADQGAPPQGQASQAPPAQGPGTGSVWIDVLCRRVPLRRAELHTDRRNLLVPGVGRAIVWDGALTISGCGIMITMARRRRAGPFSTSFIDERSASL